MLKYLLGGGIRQTFLKKTPGKIEIEGEFLHMIKN